MNDYGIDVDVVARLAVALVLGAIVGIEREIRDQPAGLRTHISVALGAALFGVISTLGFDEFEANRAETNVQIDVTRVASQVVVGIGFLGAGVIFRYGANVRNLTTAASLWVTAAIGLAAGVGDMGVALVASGGLVAALAVLRFPKDWLRRHHTVESRELTIVLAADADPEEISAAADGPPDAQVSRLLVTKRSGAFEVRLTVEGHPGRLDEVTRRLASRDDVVTLHPSVDRVDETA